MSVSGDTSEQMVKLSLEGVEVIAKLTGNGAKNVAAMLYTIIKDQKQTKGKTRLNNMLKSEKSLKIFSIKKEDLGKFKSEAKKYGILYCALVDKKNKNIDGMIDIMVKEDDASRINRIVERFKLSTVDTAKIYAEISKDMKKTEEISHENFNLATTEKNPQSEPSLITSKMQEGVSKEEKKPSVRKELAKLKMEVNIIEKIKEKYNNKAKNKNRGIL